MIKAFVRYKIYYDRARAYIGAVQFLMLAVILAKQFKIDLSFWGYCLLVLCFFAGCLIVGYVDTRLGILAEEVSTYNKQNPEIKEILKAVNELKDNSCNSCKG